ncbi:hypothetical protein M885DRAFT_506019 [Pelagophyceae sp. CCMP2097]|nr:hypothetical protein M885DRAFT_506019 [Pelagophyceae sp. CCMP2097]
MVKLDARLLYDRKRAVDAAIKRVEACLTARQAPRLAPGPRTPGASPSKPRLHEEPRTPNANHRRSHPARKPSKPEWNKFI